MVQNLNNYAAENKFILSGSSCFNHEDSDPQEIVDKAKNAVSSKIGQDPNTMVIGQDAWNTLKRNTILRSLISDSKTKLVTLDLLKEIFEIDNILIGKSIFADEKGNFQRIWKDNIILAFVPKLGASRTEYDPTFGYTIRKKDSLNVDEYTKEGNKVRYIRATDIYTPFLVGAEAGFLISNVTDPNYVKGKKEDADE